MIFELFEWAAAEFYGGDLGVAYLGTQGDVWDAHKNRSARLRSAGCCTAGRADWSSAARNERRRRRHEGGRKGSGMRIVHVGITPQHGFDQSIN
jgi:hypothetical protein